MSRDLTVDCPHCRRGRLPLAVVGTLVLCAVVSATVAWADDWPQWRGPERDGVWRESGIVDQLPSGALPHIWAVPVGPGYSGPTVADDRVYLTDRGTEGEQAEQERVLCFDARDGRLFVSLFYDGSLMLRLNPTSLAVDKLWQAAGPDEQHTESLHVMIGTPILKDRYVYGVDSYGQLRCLDADTGRRIWEDTTAVPTARWATIHMVQHAGEK